MKRYLLFILCCFYLFCHVQCEGRLPFIAIYSNEAKGRIPPTYLIIRSSPDIFEMYMPSISESVFGIWNYTNDTLFLFPQYDCNVRESRVIVKPLIHKEYETIVSIPQKYVLKQDSLIDKTDYSVIFTDLECFSENFFSLFNETYVRVK